MAIYGSVAGNQSVDGVGAAYSSAVNPGRYRVGPEDQIGLGAAQPSAPAVGSGSPVGTQAAAPGNQTPQAAAPQFGLANDPQYQAYIRALGLTNSGNVADTRAAEGEADAQYADALGNYNRTNPIEMRNLHDSFATRGFGVTGQEERTAAELGAAQQARLGSLNLGHTQQLNALERSLANAQQQSAINQGNAMLQAAQNAYVMNQLYGQGGYGMLGGQNFDLSQMNPYALLGGQP